MKGSKYYLVALQVFLLALAGFSAVSIAGTVRVWRSSAPPRVELVPPPPPVAPAAPQAVEHYRVISRRDIFNPAPQVQPAVAAPAEPMPVKLLGVAIHEDPASSYCVVEDLKSHKQAVYRTGSTFEGTSTKLLSVHWDRIVVLRGGVEETLALQAAPAPAGDGAARSPAAAAAGPAAGAAEGVPSQPAGVAPARRRGQVAADAAQTPVPTRRPVKSRRQYRAE